MGTAIVPFKGEHRFVQHCDFCAAPSHEAQLLISSPNGNHICAECVEVCMEVVREKRAEAAQ